MPVQSNCPEASLALLRAWSDPLEDAVIELSAQGSVVAWSDGAARLFGYDAREVLGQPLQQLIALRGTSAELEQALRAARSGDAVSGTWSEASVRSGDAIEVRWLVLPAAQVAGSSERHVSLIMRAQAERATLVSLLHAQTARLEIATGMALPTVDAVGTLPKALFREVAPQLLGPVCDGCMLWLKDEQDPTWLVPASIHDRDPQLERALRGEGVRVRVADPGSIGRAFRSRELQLALKTKSARALSARFASFRSGAPDAVPHSVCWVPIRTRAEPVGLLCAYRRLPGTSLLQDDLRLLNDVACRVLLARLRQRLTAEVRDIEERFVKSFHGNPAGLSVTRLEDSLIIDCNRAFASLLGFERAELIGRKFSDLGLQDAEQRANVIADVREHGPQRALEVNLRHRSGRRLSALAAVDLLELEHEQCLLTMIVDQTERREAERALRLQELMLRETGALAKVGGWQFDVRGGGGSWTEEAAAIHELDPLDPIWRDRSISFYHGQDRERITLATEAAMARAEPYDLELQIDTAKGNRRWVRTIGRPVIEDGEVVRLRGSLQDITERKLLELRLRAQLEVSRLLFESDDLDRAAPQLLRILCDLEEWQAGVLWHAQAPDAVLQVAHQWLTDALRDAEPKDAWLKDAALPAENALLERARRSGQLCELAPPPSANANATDERLHEVCAVPLMAAGEVQGVLQFFANAARPLLPDAIEALGAMAEQAGLFILKRKRAQEAGTEARPERARAAGPRRT